MVYKIVIATTLRQRWKEEAVQVVSDSTAFNRTGVPTVYLREWGEQINEERLPLCVKFISYPAHDLNHSYRNRIKK